MSNTHVCHTHTSTLNLTIMIKIKHRQNCCGGICAGSPRPGSGPLCVCASMWCCHGCLATDTTHLVKHFHYTRYSKNARKSTDVSGKRHILGWTATVEMFTRQIVKCVGSCFQWRTVGCLTSDIIIIIITYIMLWLILYLVVLLPEDVSAWTFRMLSF